MGQAAGLSNKQRKLLSRRIRKERASDPRPASCDTRVAPDEEYVTPIPANGDDIVHDVGQSGRPIAVRLDPIMKLRRAGKISEGEYRAGLAYLGVVQAYYTAKSGLARMDAESPCSMRNADPIRLYIKGRRRYVSTQKPRIIATPRTGFDGWSASRSDAMEAMGRVRRALRLTDSEAIRVLYALVIHPAAPDKRPTTLREYVLRQYGYQTQSVQDRIVALLRQALADLCREFDTTASIDMAA